MKKKSYVKPDMKVYQVQPASILAASVDASGSGSTNSGSVFGSSSDITGSGDGSTNEGSAITW